MDVLKAVTNIGGIIAVIVIINKNIDYIAPVGNI